MNENNPTTHARNPSTGTFEEMVLSIYKKLDDIILFIETPPKKEFCEVHNEELVDLNFNGLLRCWQCAQQGDLMEMDHDCHASEESGCSNPAHDRMEEL